MLVQQFSGGCPECGASDRIINVRADHYCVCDVHRVYWPVGSNIFPGWRQESDQTWRENRKTINTYRRVTPLQHGAPAPNPARACVVHIETWRQFRESQALDREARTLGYESADDPRLADEYEEHCATLADVEAQRNGYPNFAAWDKAGRPERDPAA